MIKNVTVILTCISVALGKTIFLRKCVNQRFLCRLAGFEGFNDDMNTFINSHYENHTRRLLQAESIQSNYCSNGVLDDDLLVCCSNDCTSLALEVILHSQRICENIDHVDCIIPNNEERTFEVIIEIDQSLTLSEDACLGT